MANRSSSNRNLITATFKNRKSADRAYDAVTDREGYSKDDVIVLMSDEAKSRHFDDVEIEEGNKAAEGAGVGAALGGVSGGIAGALAAVGSAIAIPGLGLVVAGPIAAALAGAGAGGGAGTLLGALIGAGIPEERAKRYKEDLKEGHMVLGIEPRNRDDAEYFERKWRDIGGERIHTGTPSEEKPREERRSEGEMSETRTSEGRMEEDRMREQRTRGERPPEERAPEHSPTERTPSSQAPTGDYTTREDSFRSHHRDTYGDSDYAEHESAYRFGHESAQSSEFRGRRYDDVEDDLRRRYMDRHPNSSWEKVKHAVRHAFTNDPARKSTGTTPRESRL